MSKTKRELDEMMEEQALKTPLFEIEEQINQQNQQQFEEENKPDVREIEYGRYSYQGKNSCL